MTSLKIILFSILSAIVYGIIHDMITANICVEYFTIGHPKIIESKSPFLLALLWGTIATWWVGLPMGILIAAFSQFGGNPKIEFKIITKLILRLILIMFMIALLAGIIGFISTEIGVIYLIPDLAEQISPDNHSKFLAVGWSHFSSYLSGIIGAFIICKIIYSKRRNFEVEF